MKAKNDIKALIASQMLEVFSSDPASLRDKDALYRSTRNILLSSKDQTDGSFRFLIETK
jgi:TusA-related sulfurtransferase